MADLHLPLTTCDDESLTCLSCGYDKCEYELQIFGDGNRTIVGIHHKCASHHESRTRWMLDSDGENIILDEYDKPKLDEKLKEEDWTKSTGITAVPGTFGSELFAALGLPNVPNIDTIQLEIPGVNSIEGIGIIGPEVPGTVMSPIDLPFLDPPEEKDK